jgi:SAM-dependent methyltransferase
LTNEEIELPSKAGDDKRTVDVAEETLRTFALTHNYNLWVVGLLTPYAGKRILEIGCGIGNLTLYFQHLGDLSCIDVSELYLGHMRIDFPGVSFYRYDAAGDEMLALRDQRFDTVICVNVLEHIRDDERAVRNVYDILDPGGRFLVYVPALQCLYSSLDRNVDHYRRYGKRQLEMLLRKSGFQIDRLAYSNLIGTLGWFLNGKIQRKRQLSIWQTILFDKFVPLVERLERHIRPGFGMSLFAVARKPAGDLPASRPPHIADR